VELLKKAGAKEVHFRVSSPPTSFSCFFGIDTPKREKLISSRLTIDEIRDFIKADTLEYLSLDELKKCVDDYDSGYCMACFDGDYPMEIPLVQEVK